ncbi:E3 ubiquitin-protein ligase RNF181-like isoform X2 [Patiria miniata]|uniref:RING-type E3 ubiquitin transferase n=1 Tax=Patiria miniata TaxID=46514 RepID=A0A914A9T7_PATMI|nr:E3 ubiquitin-protein ligase RNF181-like isoform X2 [Patiria miniata]
MILLFCDFVPFLQKLTRLKKAMASYFDEHDCEETDGSGPDANTLLRWARLDYFGGERKGPPASKEVVAKLPDKMISEDEDSRCPICLVDYNAGEQCKVLPCKHDFHPRCILPWLAQTNTCPVCRHELPTDDEDYEEFQREKARTKQRDFERESLHSSMYT